MEKPPFKESYFKLTGDVYDELLQKFVEGIILKMHPELEDWETIITLTELTEERGICVKLIPTRYNAHNLRTSRDRKDN